MEETYQIIEGTPTLHDLDAENGFLWCPFGYSGRQNEPGILISRLDDGSYDVRLGTGLDSPERYAAVRDGTPIDGLHFYYGDEPKPAPEFFKPEKVKGGKSPAQMAAAARAAAGSSGRPDGGQRQWRAV